VIRSGKGSDAANDNLTDRICQIWQPRLGRDLSRDEAKQIVANLTGFFSVLAAWSRAELPAPANDNGDGASSDDQGARHDC
jgi:hypothetical protein